MGHSVDVLQVLLMDMPRGSGRQSKVYARFAKTQHSLMNG